MKSNPMRCDEAIAFSLVFPMRCDEAIAFAIVYIAIGILIGVALVWAISS